jgi:hypothetical protein
VTLEWDFDGQYAARAQVERAVGVLMELCGWEASTARSNLIRAAANADAPVETVAEAILALGAEHPDSKPFPVEQAGGISPSPQPNVVTDPGQTI